MQRMRMLLVLSMCALTIHCDAFIKPVMLFSSQKLPLSSVRKVMHDPLEISTLAPMDSRIRSHPYRLRMNLFSDFFDDSKLKPQNPPANPLLKSLVRDRAESYVLQEKMFSFSGEDFRVRDIHGDEVISVQGGNVNLGGWVIDKLGFKDSRGEKFCSVERRMVALSTCYDVYNAKGDSCVAKIERVLLSAAPKYNFFYEGDMNPFPDFTAEGSFSQRKYTFKNGFGETIARVSRGEEMVRDVDQYQVEVAAGVDAAAILAVAVVIDEDHDEMDSEKREEMERNSKQE